MIKLGVLVVFIVVIAHSNCASGASVRLIKVAFPVFATGNYAAYIPTFLNRIKLHFCSHQPMVVPWVLVYSDQPVPYDAIASASFRVHNQSADSRIELAPGIRVVELIHHRSRGWPYDSLLRANNLLDGFQQQYATRFDFIIFQDVDLVLTSQVCWSLLKSTAFVLWPWYHGHPRSTYPVEDREESFAYVNRSHASGYYAGGLMIGDPPSFLHVVQTMTHNIVADLDGGRRPAGSGVLGAVATAKGSAEQGKLVARHHDESHLNSYVWRFGASTILSPAFLWPEPGLDVWLTSYNSQAHRHLYVTADDERPLHHGALVRRQRMVITHLQKRGGTSFLRDDTMNSETFWMEKLYRTVTVGIKTIGRQNCLHRLLVSIFSRYPRLQVIVVDDSKRTDSSYLLDSPNVRYVKRPFDSLGVGAGRNLMVNLTTTPYLLVLDDDTTLPKHTQLEHMLQVLEGGYVPGQQRSRRRRRIDRFAGPAGGADVGMDIVAGTVDGQSWSWSVEKVVKDGRVTLEISADVPPLPQKGPSDRRISVRG